MRRRGSCKIIITDFWGVEKDQKSLQKLVEFQKYFKVTFWSIFPCDLFHMSSRGNVENKMLPRMFAFYESPGPRIKLPLAALRRRVTFSFTSALNCISYPGAVNY